MVTTVAEAAGTVAAVVTLRLRRFEVPAAQHAPVQTAIQMMTTQIMMHRVGTTTAITIPTITAVLILDVMTEKSVKLMKLIFNYKQSQQSQLISITCILILAKITVIC